MRRGLDGGETVRRGATGLAGLALPGLALPGLALPGLALQRLKSAGLELAVRFGGDVGGFLAWLAVSHGIIGVTSATGRCGFASRCAASR